MLTCIPPHYRQHILSPRADLVAERRNISDSLAKRPGAHILGTAEENTGETLLIPTISEKEIWSHKLRSVKDDGRVLHCPNSFRKIWILSLIFSLYILAHLPSLLTNTILSHQQSRNTVPDLPKDFFTQCESLLPPPPGTQLNRLSKLVSALSQNYESWVWISEPGPSASYFLGSFSIKDWWLSERPFLIAITPSTSPDVHTSTANITLLTPEFERLRAELIQLPKEIRSAVTFVAWKESDDPYKILADHLGRVDGVVLDPMVRSFVENGLGDAIFGEGKPLSLGDEKPVKTAVGLIRERKDEREIGLLRCANQMTLHAIRKTKGRMHFGITESQTRDILEEEMLKVGLEGGDGLVLFGENAALPHGSGTDRVLGKSDMVLIDAGGKWGGYVADITRTFALPGSKIPEEHIGVWETVRQAQKAPYDLLVTSRTSFPPKLGDLDKAARNLISKQTNRSTASTKDSPDFSIFTHRLGHGIGLEGHEQPYLVQGPQGEKVVQIGHVFSLEPGIYLPQNVGFEGLPKGLGVRLEDCFVVSERDDGMLGGEWLSGPVGGWGDV